MLLEQFAENRINPGNWHSKKRLEEIHQDPNPPFHRFSWRVFHTHVKEIMVERQRECELGEGLLVLCCSLPFRTDSTCHCFFLFLHPQLAEVASPQGKSEPPLRLLF